jgi:hypothetical protein
MALTPQGEILSFFTNPETRKRYAKIAKKIGATGLAGGAVTLGVFHGIENAHLVGVTNDVKAAAGTQEVKSIDLKLNEACITGFTTQVNKSSAKLETNVEVLGAKVDVLSPWRTNTVSLEADSSMCMDGNEAKGSYDPTSHHMVVAIDNKKIYTRIEVQQASVHVAHSSSPNSLPAEFVAGAIKGTFLNDVDVLKGLATGDDGADSYLTNAATLTGLNAVVNNCGPQVVPKTQSAFKQTVKDNILAIASQIDPQLKVDVYIGSQTPDNPDAPQAISDRSNVKASFDKLAASKDTVISAGNIGDCKVPAGLVSAATAAGSQAKG